jgi:general secretion pathway protein A
VLTAWGEPPLVDDDIRVPNDLEAVAWRHGLEQLQLTANRSMLRLLDLPAILVMQGERTGQARYVALIGLDESDAVLSVDGELVGVESDALQRVWNGQAHVLWKDFAGLGPTMQPGTRGLVVVQLQQLLRRNGGAANLETTGMFDAGTSRAVVEFQRGHRLDADGLVGPLTRIVLYAAGKDNQRPALSIARAEGSS